MQLRLVLLGGGNALGQALVRLGAEEDISFLAPKPEQGAWDAASLTSLIDDVRPDALINLAYYYDWFQAGAVDPLHFVPQERAVERLAQLCKHYDCILLQPSSYRVFDGARATAYNETNECKPLSPRGQALMRMEQSVRSLCSKHVLLRFGWLLDDSPEGMLGRVLRRAQDHELIEMADDRRGNPTPVEDASASDSGHTQTTRLCCTAVGYIPLRWAGSGDRIIGGASDFSGGASMATTVESKRRAACPCGFC